MKTIVLFIFLLFVGSRNMDSQWKTPLLYSILKCLWGISLSGMIVSECWSNPSVADHILALILFFSFFAENSPELSESGWLRMTYYKGNIPLAWSHSENIVFLLPCEDKHVWLSTYLSTVRTTRSSWSARASIASFSSLTFCPPPIDRPTSPPFHASPIPNTWARTQGGQDEEPTWNQKKAVL